MKTPDLPEEKPSAPDKRDSIIADSRQKGLIDATLAGSISFLAVCAWMLWWLP